MKKQITNAARRNVLLIFFLVSIYSVGNAQVYNTLNYNYNSTPTYGVKIKTNLPFQNGSQMPTVIIEGFNYGEKRPMGLILNWYIFDGAFYMPKMSSFGADLPKIKLSVEGGNVVIYIDERNYFQRFTVRAFAQGMSEQSAWFSGWTTADEPLSGSNTVEVPYENSFKGIVNLPNGIWKADGNVGIGTPNPDARLEIGVPHVTNQSEAMRIGSVYNNGFYGIGMNYRLSSTGDPSAHIKVYKGGGASIDAMSFNVWSGNVGIGTTNPDALLTVNGTIHAKEILVDNNILADYVFHPSYNLMPLTQVEQYVKTNSHLPEMPSAAEVSKNGMNMGDMQNKLLQKVEELTLYVIELQKTNIQQSAEINQLKQQLKK